MQVIRGDDAGVGICSASGVLPDGKRKPDKGTWKARQVAMVGDGINDALHSLGQMSELQSFGSRCSGSCCRDEKPWNSRLSDISEL